MDKNTEVQETPAPAPVQFDEEMLSRIVSETVKATVKAEASERTQETPTINADAEKVEAKVKGERVPQWQKRAVRHLNAVVNRDAGETMSEKQKGVDTLHELDRMERASADWQKGEEQDHINFVISNSGLSNRVQKRLHSTLTGPAGEFALPKPFLAELFVIIEQYGLARQNARIINMTTKDLDLKSISTKPTVAWTGESVNFTESDLALNEQKLTTNKLAAITSLSTELSEDSALALLPSWIQLVGEDIAKKEDQAWLIGDGTSTYGNFTGLSNLSSAQVNTLGSSDLKFGDVVEADLRTTKEQLSLARQTGARWFMHRGLWNEIEQFESTAGDRIVQRMLQNPGERGLFGFPVILSEAMVDATADVANVDFAIFGNPTYSLMGIARGITVDASREAILSDSNGVVTFNAFQGDGQLLRISERIGFQTPSAVQDAFAVMNAPAS